MIWRLAVIYVQRFSGNERIPTPPTSPPTLSLALSSKYVLLKMISVDIRLAVAKYLFHTVFTFMIELYSALVRNIKEGIITKGRIPQRLEWYPFQITSIYCSFSCLVLSSSSPPPFEQHITRSYLFT